MKKILLGFIAFCVLGVIIIGYYFLTSNNETETSFSDLDVNDEVVLKLYQRVNPSDDYSAMSDVYKKGTFSNQFILGTSLVALLTNSPDSTVVKEEDVNLMVKQIFGSITYAHESGYMINNSFCAFQYDKTNHQYTFVKGCENSSVTLLRKIVKASKSDTEYIITEKLIVVEQNVDEQTNETITKLYKDINRTSLIEMSNYNNSIVNIDDYLEKASTYEYYFEFDGESFVYRNLKKVN